MLTIPIEVITITSISSMLVIQAPCEILWLILWLYYGRIYRAYTLMTLLDILETTYPACFEARCLGTNKNGDPKATVRSLIKKEIPWREFLFNTMIKL